MSDDAAERLAQLIATWRTLRPEVLDPEAVNDRCHLFSQDFLGYIRLDFPDANLISGGKFEQCHVFQNEVPFEVLTQGHVAVVVGDTVVDWTAHQFDPELPVPLVTTVCCWRDEWSDLNARPRPATPSEDAP